MQPKTQWPARQLAQRAITAHAVTIAKLALGITVSGEEKKRFLAVHTFKAVIASNDNGGDNHMGKFIALWRTARLEVERARILERARAALPNSEYQKFLGWTRKNK